MVAQKAVFQLVDVREPGEREICQIPGSINISQKDIVSGKGLTQLDRQVPVILYCKMGGRSRKALLALQEHGFEDLKNLEGGILNWIRQVDQSLATY